MIYSEEKNFLLLRNLKVGSSSMEVELSKVLPENTIVTPIVIDPPANHKPRNYDGFHGHMGVDEVINIIGEEKYNSLETAIFVRNPYHQVLSHFFMTIKVSGIQDWSLHIDNYFNDRLSIPWLTSTRDIYMIGDDIRVKNILFYEKGIEKELNKVLKKINMPYLKINAWEKKFNKDDLKYKDVFSDKHIKIINDSWWWEFENLGYKKDLV
jgi:hypothetical protein